MLKTLKFLKECGTFYIATNEGDQPRVRPFGAICLFEDRLYLTTNNRKPVYHQMLTNPKIEISGMSGDSWIRIAAEAVHDTNRAARVAMLEEYEALTGMYQADDNLMEVFYLKNAAVTINSLTAPPREFSF